VKSASRSQISHGEHANKPVGNYEIPLRGEDTSTAMKGSSAILLTSTCRSQLRAYVRHIASMYRRNQYHGLEHAVHVTMSANKLHNMLREESVESAQDIDIDAGICNSASESNVMKPGNNHHRHHKLSSDMFTKFAFVFAAMIHDVDHQGVPNTRLALENDPIVELNDPISVAERHSIKVAFRSLSERSLRNFIL